MGFDIPKACHTVVVAHPGTLIRESLVALVETGPFLVVAKCCDGEDVLAAFTLPPQDIDIVILEINLAKVYALEVARRLSAINPKTKIALLTNGFDTTEVMESLRVGVNGIFLSTSTVENLFEGFAHMLAGGIYLAPQLTMDKVLPTLKSGELVDSITTLSAREHQVFNMLVEGVRPKEIAGRLQLSPKTIDTYRASLMRKLEVHDVVGLVKLALRLNLTSLRPQSVN